MLDWLCCLHHQFDWNFRVLIWDYSFIFHLNSCVLVILAKDLTFDKTRNTHALVYGRKPDLLGINVVDYVYYYYAYCYYKTIIKPHKIQYIFLNLLPGNSYSQLQLSLTEGLKNPPQWKSALWRQTVQKSLLTHIFLSLSLQVTQLDPNKTLLEVKLYPQETLFLEAKE